MISEQSVQGLAGMAEFIEATRQAAGNPGAYPSDGAGLSEPGGRACGEHAAVSFSTDAQGRVDGAVIPFEPQVGAIVFAKVGE